MRYTTLYFDLDDTLLDFSAAERVAIKQLLNIYGIDVKDSYVKLYSEINRSFWQKFERGEIKREEIFEGRFVEFTRRIGVTADTAKMCKDYFSLLSEGHFVLPGAKDVLEYVKGKGYTVCVTTNGVAKTQHKRISESGLEDYFDYVFISEDTGHQKPEREYFEYVYNNTPEKDKAKILVIGDSLTSDITGGINFGIDTCWLNMNGKKSGIMPKYQIADITDLIGIL